jgi:Ni,Fe-hydrogenase I large subunit
MIRVKEVFLCVD